MPKRILIVSTFPPTHCGIASYAQEHLLSLKREGSIVYTLSFDPSSAVNFRFDSARTWEILKAFLFLVTHNFDTVYLNFTNGLIWQRHPIATGYLNKLLLMVWTFALALRFGKRSVLIAHEILTDELLPHSRWVHRWIYRCFGTIQFHTEREREQFVDCFGHGLLDKTQLIVHHQHFVPKFRGSKEDARRLLGLSLTQTIFLSIGFLIKTKGFEDGVRAIAQLPGERYHLYIVGSMREPKDAIHRYRDFLAETVRKVPQASLLEKHLSDVEFDQWIVAADAVLLPYRVIWSSGVAARCQILHTPVICRKHRNLLNQLQHGLANFFESDAELLACLQASAPKSNDQHFLEPLPPKRKILFVIGAFGKRVRGGAERFVFELANELSQRGADLEVWTTDSSEVVGRKPDLSAEEDVGLSFKVRRFAVNHKMERWFNLVHRLMVRPVHYRTWKQTLWKRTNIYGAGMREALESEGQHFDVIHLFHYLHGTSHRLSGIFPEKTLLHPFIHDEALLYNPIMRELFAGVRGVTCNTVTCSQLALGASCGLAPSLYIPIGNGVERRNFPTNSLFEIPFAGPYLVFLGRMIAEKNLDQLFAWHERLLQEDGEAPALLCVGHGPLQTHTIFQRQQRVAHMAWVGEDDKAQILSHALALVQLSKLESFSLVIMEAWLQGAPVIVHKQSPALLEHIEASQGGGFAVASYSEYATAVRALCHASERAHRGKLGQAYVEKKFNWNQVCQNYFEAVDSLIV